MEGDLHLNCGYGITILDKVLIKVTQPAPSICLNNFQVTIDGEESVISLTEEPGAGSCLDGLGKSRKNFHSDDVNNTRK